MDLKNKTVVITGASSGIGKSCAEQFAKRGANLVLGARQYVTLCEIAQDLEQRFGIKAIAVQCDVSKELDCMDLINQAKTTFNRIDVLINNVKSAIDKLKEYRTALISAVVTGKIDVRGN